MRNADKVTRDSLVGLWRRSLLAYPDGRCDETTDVTWLQGPSLYGDLRLPHAAPDVKAACLRDLSFESIAVLARQDGFAGTLVQSEECFEWERLIDYQPTSEHADRGTLTRDGELLVELGVDVAYREHWHRQSGVVTPAEAVLVENEMTRTKALLLRVGPRFLFARDRAVRLRPGGHLVDQLKAVSSLEIAQDLIDCEISIGSVEDGWRIVASTLPWRRGSSIAPRRIGCDLVLHDIEPDGTPVVRGWAILHDEVSV